MRLKTIVAAVTGLVALGGCQIMPETSVAEYCAQAGNSDTHVCQLEMEIQGTRTALAQSDMSLDQANALADQAITSAAEAQRSAEAAQATADEAMQRANAALAEDDLICETRTLQQTNIGTCAEGFTLMSCTQTRYTHRAGGLSFLREINNEQCRFNSQVLEMQVRCCAAATRASVPLASLITASRGSAE